MNPLAVERGRPPTKEIASDVLSKAEFKGLAASIGVIALGIFTLHYGDSQSNRVIMALGFTIVIAGFTALFCTVGGVVNAVKDRFKGQPSDQLPAAAVKV